MPSKNSSSTFVKAEVVKVDEELGLVFGWGIICKIDGEPYFDTQRDHIPEDAMLRATADFMLKSRISGEMHARDAQDEPVQDGDVVFSFPLTTEVAKALEIETQKTGWLVAVRPSPGVLALYKAGKYTGFSIGGTRVRDEDEVEKFNENHDPETGRFAEGDGGGGGGGGGGGSGGGGIPDYSSRRIPERYKRIETQLLREKVPRLRIRNAISAVRDMEDEGFFGEKGNRAREGTHSELMSEIRDHLEEYGPKPRY